MVYDFSIMKSTLYANIAYGIKQDIKNKNLCQLNTGLSHNSVNVTGVATNNLKGTTPRLD